MDLHELPDRPSVTPWRRAVPILGFGAVVLLVGAGLGAAGFAVFAPGRDVETSPSFVTATVAEGEVGSTLTLNTVASWSAGPVGVNRGAGVVTSIDVGDGDEVKAGDILYTLDLRPTVVAVGTIPSFRDLSAGSEGADVAQLQRLLAELGFISGSADGRFGTRTSRAVLAWQRQLGVATDGVVRAGDLIYMPALPIRVVVDRDLLVVGGTLVGGETIMSGLSSEPTFAIPVTSSQALLLDVGTPVEISGGGGLEWEAAVDNISTNEDGETIAYLAGIDGASICAPDCGVLSPRDETLLTSRVIVVETVVGPRLPTAAVQTRADLSTFVTDIEGVEHDVSVIASARGLSVVRGVDVGLNVRVPSEQR